MIWSIVIAYDRVGIEEAPELYDIIALEECAKVEAAFRDISVEMSQIR